jgi:outer membrane protein OmpA-like peptidoglycan-associated protein
MYFQANRKLVSPRSQMNRCRLIPWHVVMLVALVFFSMTGASTFAAATIEFLNAKPLYESPLLAGAHLKPVKGGVLKVPTITWPGDVSTISTDMEGLFKQEGLDVQLFCENDFAKQVKGVLEGETPLLRGTMGMINSAAETFAKNGSGLVVVYQLTWSAGGDVLVVRPDVKSLPDLKGKSVALQLYGPHMDYLTTILSKAGLKPTDVKACWLKELSLPTYDTHGLVVDPRTAFERSAKIDAAFVISPDSAALTSGGTGTGAEGSVKGARALFSSKSANRVISDVYAVRADYFKANRAKIQKFVHALMVGQEHFSRLLANKSDPKYKPLIKRSAELLFGSPQATGDVEGSLGDCEWVGYPGNVAFFTGQGTLRNFDTLKNEIQTGFIPLNIMKAKAPLDKAGWNYKDLAAGLSKQTASTKQAFDVAKTQAAVEKQVSTELTKWEKQGSLYQFEIYFKPNQSAFTSAEYSDAFKKALELSQTMGGTLITIEGHNSPDALNKARSEGQSQEQLNALQQAAKTLSYKRAMAVRQAYLGYCQQTGVKVDESQFVPVGMGTKSPKFQIPQNEDQWNKNRRVVFRVKAVETELDSFRPPGK